MPETMTITDDNLNRAGEFACYLLIHAIPYIDQMRLTPNEVELAFSYLIAELLSHRPDDIRPLLTAQWQGLVDPGAWPFPEKEGR